MAITNDNVVITINGVRYEMSPQHFLNVLAAAAKGDNIFQEEPIQVEKDEMADTSVAPKAEPIQVAQKETAVQPKKTVPSEQLTTKALKRLIGHTNVIYYDFNKKVMVPDTLNYDIPSNLSVAEKYDRTCEREKLKKNLDENSDNFDYFIIQKHPEYEFVAAVIMLTDVNHFNCHDDTRLIQNPPYVQNAKYVVGNLIMRDKATGKLELCGNNWFSVWSYDSTTDAIKFGMGKFLLYMTCLDGWETMHKSYSNERTEKKVQQASAVMQSERTR